MKFFYGIVFIFISQSAFAQYLPVDTADSNQRKSLKIEYESRFEKFNKQIKENYSGKERKEILEILEAIQADFLEEIENGNFILDEKVQSIANQMMREIQSGNPSIPNDMRILISKHGTVNGYSMFDGTLVLNLGCFKYLENEDQIASIISHEIAHKVLEHMMNSIVKRVNANQSEFTREKVKSIKKSDSGRNTEALQMMRNFLYEEGERRRKEENEADSLGFIYYEKTDYENRAFIDAFKLMQRYDTIKPVGVEIETYRKLFDLPEQPFQDSWLEMEDFSEYDYEKFIEKYNQDSIASHPEMVERIAFMKNHFPTLRVDSMMVDKIPSQRFLDLQKLALEDEVPNLYFLKQYGVAVYICLYQLQEGGDELFYKYWLGQCFAQIYKARKSYKLNKYLETVSPKDQSESYMQFLNFMWNLNLAELKMITEFYAPVPV